MSVPVSTRLHRVISYLHTTNQNHEHSPTGTNGCANASATNVSTSSTSPNESFSAIYSYWLMELYRILNHVHFGVHVFRQVRNTTPSLNEEISVIRKWLLDLSHSLSGLPKATFLTAFLAISSITQSIFPGAWSQVEWNLSNIPSPSRPKYLELKENREFVLYDILSFFKNTEANSLGRGISFLS